jgi:ribosomal protein S18 acetylase RimI-like enzyme
MLEKRRLRRQPQSHQTSIRRIVADIMSDKTVSDFRIRRAEFDDLLKIVELLADDDLGKLREDAGQPLNSNYASAFNAIDADPHQLLVVVEDAGGIVGCLQLSFIPGLSRLGLLRGQIESVRIASAKRDRGIGRFMLEWALEECRRRRRGLVQLTTDKARPEALKFYQSLGFRASHEGLKLAI